MDIFGLSPIIAAIAITGIGVGVQVGLGFLQSTTAFDPKKLIASAIISVFAAFGIVIPVLTALPEDIDQLTQLSVFIGTIAAIAGIDQLVKNTGASILKKKSKVS